jgi:hypothetical protein
MPNQRIRRELANEIGKKIRKTGWFLLPGPNGSSDSRIRIRLSDLERWNSRVTYSDEDLSDWQINAIAASKPHQLRFSVILRINGEEIAVKCENREIAKLFVEALDSAMGLDNSNMVELLGAVKDAHHKACEEERGERVSNDIGIT